MEKIDAEVEISRTVNEIEKVARKKKIKEKNQRVRQLNKKKKLYLEKN